MDRGLATTAQPTTTDPPAPPEDHGRAGAPLPDGARVPAQGLPAGHPDAEPPEPGDDAAEAERAEEAEEAEEVGGGSGPEPRGPAGGRRRPDHPA
ncbi:hypothetical protein ACFU6L_09330, partial [Kitasatospora sp. NPDC057541]